MNKMQVISINKDEWQVGRGESNHRIILNSNLIPSCECTDFKIKKRCQHILALEKHIFKEREQQNGSNTKITYSQDWHAYDNSQTNEKILFFKLLKDICCSVEQPEYKFGRPKIPISYMIFSSALKVYSTFSLRRFISDLKIARECGAINYVPCYASIGHFLQREDITPILKELIKLSASPLSSVESSFAVDSSGFSTCRFARWFDTKWGKDKKQRIWLKAHLMSGTKTNIVTCAEITEGSKHDAPFLEPLLKETCERFNVKELSADKGYLSKDNFRAIEDSGASPYIPFKSNSNPRSHQDGTVSLWKKMYYLFMYRQEEFSKCYHLRSNAETVFHMIKTKFKDSLRSKTKTAQINELLLKILCHNICCVIQEMNELGIKGEFVVEEKIR